MMGGVSQTLHQNYGNQTVKAVVGGQSCCFRSKGEYNLALYLEFLKEQGEVIRWVHELREEIGELNQPPLCCDFFFEGVRRNPISFLIDFAVEYPGGNIMFWEYKGWLQGKDVSKFKRMAKFYPDEKIILVMAGKANKDAGRLRQIRKYAHRIIYAADLFKPVRGIVGFI